MCASAEPAERESICISWSVEVEVVIRVWWLVLCLTARRSTAVATAAEQLRQIHGRAARRRVVTDVVAEPRLVDSVVPDGWSDD